LLLKRLAVGAPPSSSPRSKAMATEAAGIRPRSSCFYPFQAWVSWCSKGSIKNLVAVASSNLNLALEGPAIR
jgi:hypothetical protein